MNSWMNLNLQNSNSPMMEQLMFFHNHSLLIILLITIFISYLMSSLFFNKINNRIMMESQTMEMIWTIMPMFMLIFIALPSIRLLYLLDDSNNPLISIKSIGHQWYWNYEYSDFMNISFDSYMISSNDLNLNFFRLLDVDNRIILPYNTNIRIIITASDVLHSWTIPSLGIKVDATPGRLNQTNFYMNRPGLYFGQCSEICGANHSFMPIVIESISINSFIKWINMNS
uniref:Cytochrome c oxidase subunit 2 n=3 Tax=Xenopsylla brasiliensis TaxID=1225568 RepID=A0A3G5AY33_9NEOP|nr:cytochrome c oxidase subunit II [Xenopsylla brasiliensis]AYV92162.1 cytochrome c oxidase subunit II [Xenopsylla brasiliensis]AYV92163.1 cytochrome c oxidase subunit II [Xenopsylla brasiliensis]AYV92164.1 cytochrome c oxidase subunit II [Xenopsylla brasiliensis]